MGHSCIQPGVRDVPEFRGGDFQGGPEGYQQGCSRAGASTGRVYDRWSGAGVSLRKEEGSGELLS